MALQDLMARRAECLKGRTELGEKILSEDREFTEDERTRFDGLKQEVEALDRKIEITQEVAGDQAALDAKPKRRTQPEQPQQPGRLDVEIGPPNLAQDPTGGYGERGFGDFAFDVASARRGRASERLGNWQTAYLAAGDGLTASIGSEGAYLIPPQFGALVDKIALEAAIIRPRAVKIPMTAPRLSFPMIDDTSHATTVFGGVQAYFKSEEAQLTSSKPTFANVELDLHKLTALCYVSNEMLDWSPLSLDTWLPQKLGEAITWKEEDKFINGTGTGGEPTGVLQAACILQISKETGQAATTIVFENVIKMDARLWAMAGRQSVVWIANRTVKPQLASMTLDVGTGGLPVFLPPTGAAERPYETLYGYPVLFTEHAQALGTAGDLLLVNLGEYLIGDAAGKTRSARDMGLKFDYDQTAFRVVTYTGGLCPWRAVFTPQNGDTLSPIIKLQTRS